MILLFIFLSYWFGILTRWYIYPFLFLLLGLLLFIFFKYNKKLSLLCACVSLLGVGVSFINISSNRVEYKGIVYEVKENYFLFNSNGERLYVKEKGTNREIGDIIQIQGNKVDLDFEVLESSFDFKDYLNKKGVFKELKILKCGEIFITPFKFNKAKNNFLDKLSDENRGIVSSILFSINEYDETSNSIRNLHITKLLSASGTYIYLIISLLSYFLGKVFPKKWAELMGFSICFLYLLFVFPKFSAVRITYLFLLRWINKHVLNNKFSYLTVISFSGLTFLLFDSFLALQDGFLLGYIIPLGFYFIRDSLKSENRIMRRLLPSILIYIFLIPIELRFYNCICPLSMIFQIIFTPLFVLTSFISILSFFGLPLTTILSFVIDGIKWVTKIFSYINLSFYAPSLSPILVIIFYLVFFLILYLIKIRFIPLKKLSTYCSIILLLIYFIPINNFITEEVTFINVGQGDSCLVRKQNTTILIDTGGLTYTDIASNTLIPFFKKKRIYDIDLVITTHDDTDHCGALDSLKTNFNVKNYISDAQYFPINIGGLKLYNYNIHAGGFTDENDNSLVIGFNIMNLDFLIMGDAPISIEKKIMEDFDHIDCDVLKVGHHGSETSTSQAFLNYLSPKQAIISVGKNNRYGHPNKQVINRLISNRIIIKRTDESGTITYKKSVFNKI